MKRHLELIRLVDDGVWKPIPNYDYYEISDQGRVRSLDRTIITNKGMQRKIKGKVLKPGINNYGYSNIVLINNDGRKTHSLHKLVAICFLDHKPEIDGFNVDHINGIRDDNRLENLQLITPRENSSKDQWRHNRSSKYVGVNWDKSTSKWYCMIRINNIGIYLGRFDDEEEASKMYQSALVNINEFNGCNKTFRKLLQEQI